jgi:hypothetical protein
MIGLRQGYETQLKKAGVNRVEARKSEDGLATTQFR